MANRPRLDRDSLRVSEWPQVDDRALAGDVQAMYRRRRDAVRAYAAGEAMANILAMGVDRSMPREARAEAPEVIILDQPAPAAGMPGR